MIEQKNRHPFWLALSQVWRLKPSSLTTSAQASGQAMSFIPLAALLLGVLLTAMAWLFHDFPAQVVAALVLIVWIKFSGATTLDGLAKASDAMLSREVGALQSLKNGVSRPLGTAGIVLLVLSLLLKWALIVRVIEEGWWTVLVLMPLVGWSFGQMVMLGSRWVKDNAWQEGWRAHVSLSWLWPQWLLLFTALALASGWALTLLIIGTWGWIVWWRKHLGGITESVALMWVEVSELVWLLGLVLVLGKV